MIIVQAVYTLGIASMLDFFNAFLGFMAHVNTYQASKTPDSCIFFFINPPDV